MLVYLWYPRLSQMGSRCKKALIAESVRDSLHSWCKRVKERSKHDASVTTRSTCSLGSTIDEGDEIITVASGTISPCSSTGSLNQLDDDNMVSTDQPDAPMIGTSIRSQHELSFRVSEYASYDITNGTEGNVEDEEEGKVETLFDLFRKTWTSLFRRYIINLRACTILQRFNPHCNMEA